MKQSEGSTQPMEIVPTLCLVKTKRFSSIFLLGDVKDKRNIVKPIGVMIWGQDSYKSNGVEERKGSQHNPRRLRRLIT